MSSRKNLRLALATAAAAALTGGLLGAAPATAAPSSEPAHAPASAKAPAKAPAKGAKYADDYNGDGIRDFATSDFPGFAVRYGVKGGGATKQKYIDQDSPGIPGKGTETDSFGEVLATADFNQDGYADLAVGDSSEKVGKRKYQGAVTIVWGAKKTGLGAKATLIPAKKPRADGYFGMALAAGDFNGDGKPDLAVGDRDTVHILRGPFSSQTGKTGGVTAHRPAGGKRIVPLGLVAGNVTGDKATDLYAIGLGSEDKKAKSVTWFLKGGTTVTGGAHRTTNDDGYNSLPLGAIADFDKNGYGDLALSEVQHKKFSGAVTVLPGSGNGPAGSYRITQDSAGVASAATKDDLFGNSLSAGDADRDSYPDLAVGAPGEKVGALKSAGGVHILRGGPKGLTGAKSQWFTKSTAGVPGTAKEYDFFGEYLALRDMDHDGDADVYTSDTDEKSVLIEGAKGGLDFKSAREVRVTAEFVQ